MSLKSEGKHIPPPGKFRVLGCDTFEAPDADYLIGTYDTLQEAKDVADKRGGTMNPVYIFDDRGQIVYSAGNV